MKVYERPEDGLQDALRLYDGMTYKWAAMDFPFGGGSRGRNPPVGRVKRKRPPPHESGRGPRQSGGEVSSGHLRCPGRG